MSEPIAVKSKYKADWNEATKVILVEPKKKKFDWSPIYFVGFCVSIMLLYYFDNGHF